jgi:hypothetical protein
MSTNAKEAIKKVMALKVDQPVLKVTSKDQPVAVKTGLALYEIADQYMIDLGRLADMEDIDEQTLADTLEGLSGDLEVKSTAVAQFICNLESNAEAIKKAEAMMAERRKKIESRANNIREYLLKNLQRTGISKIESVFFNITVRENPESLIVDAQADIPPEYYTQPPLPEPVLDKIKLKAAIKAGCDFLGARLERKMRLDIK